MKKIKILNLLSRIFLIISYILIIFIPPFAIIHTIIPLFLSIFIIKYDNYETFDIVIESIITVLLSIIATMLVYL